MVFENRVLRRIFDSKCVGVTGQWRKLHIEEFSDLYISLNIFRGIKIRRKDWEGHVHYCGEERNIQGFGGVF